jgi:hypothetical protein
LGVVFFFPPPPPTRYTGEVYRGCGLPALASGIRVKAEAATMSPENKIAEIFFIGIGPFVVVILHRRIRKSSKTTGMIES